MSAIISDDGVYRYRLARDIELDREPPMCPQTIATIMVNPSTADAENNDPTIVRLLGFAARLGARRLLVGNKFAFRSTDVKQLARWPSKAVGPENDEHLRQIMLDADVVIVGWGPLAKLPEVLRGRWKEVVRIADRVGRPLYCLGVAKDGHPRHPLMLPVDAPLSLWPVPWFANRHPLGDMNSWQSPSNC